jgi:hypothetical protein
MHPPTLAQRRINGERAMKKTVRHARATVIVSQK